MASDCDFESDILNDVLSDGLNDDYNESSDGAIPIVSGAVAKSLRTTLPRLTKYEKARILGIRATQISEGAKPTIEIPPGRKLEDSLRIAEEELKSGSIKLIVRRWLPDGSYEDWSLSELLKF